MEQAQQKPKYHGWQSGSLRYDRPKTLPESLQSLRESILKQSIFCHEEFKVTVWYVYPWDDKWTDKKTLFITILTIKKTYTIYQIRFMDVQIFFPHWMSERIKCRSLGLKRIKIENLHNICRSAEFFEIISVNKLLVIIYFEDWIYNTINTIIGRIDEKLSGISIIMNMFNNMLLCSWWD